MDRNMKGIQEAIAPLNEYVSEMYANEGIDKKEDIKESLKLYRKSMLPLGDSPHDKVLRSDIKFWAKLEAKKEKKRIVDGVVNNIHKCFNTEGGFESYPIPYYVAISCGGKINETVGSYDNYEEAKKYIDEHANKKSDVLLPKEFVLLNGVSTHIDYDYVILETTINKDGDDAISRIEDGEIVTCKTNNELWRIKYIKRFYEETPIKALYFEDNRKISGEMILMDTFEKFLKSTKGMKKITWIENKVLIQVDDDSSYITLFFPTISYGEKGYKILSELYLKNKIKNCLFLGKEIKPKSEIYKELATLYSSTLRLISKNYL